LIDSVRYYGKLRHYTYGEKMVEKKNNFSII
jgi:hypothetical protein